VDSQLSVTSTHYTGTVATERTLDVGCGINKLPGSIGIDRNARSKADVLCDLDHFPFPFRDNSFARLQAIHVIEHVSDVMRTMEEFHRLVVPAGRYFWPRLITRTFRASATPHTAGILNSFSFRYFGQDNAGYGYYSAVGLREKKVHVRLLALWRYLGFEFLVNASTRFRRFWEYYLCYVVRGKVMEFEFEVLK